MWWKDGLWSPEIPHYRATEVPHAISPPGWLLRNIPGEALTTSWKRHFANVCPGTSCGNSRQKSWISFCYYPRKPATINYSSGVIWFSCSFPAAVHLGWWAQPLLWCFVSFPPRWQTSSLRKAAKTTKKWGRLLFSTSFVLLNVQKGHARGKDLLQNLCWAEGKSQTEKKWINIPKFPENVTSLFPIQACHSYLWHAKLTGKAILNTKLRHRRITVNNCPTHPTTESQVKHLTFPFSSSQLLVIFHCNPANHAEMVNHEAAGT